MRMVDNDAIDLDQVRHIQSLFKYIGRLFCINYEADGDDF